MCDGDEGVERKLQKVYFPKESTAKNIHDEFLSDYLGTSVDTTSIRSK